MGILLEKNNGYDVITDEQTLAVGGAFLAAAAGRNQHDADREEEQDFFHCGIG